MKIAGMLRVKNEARWIGRVLDSIAPICSSVHVFDDRSSDDTAAISLAHGADVYPTPFEPCIDETRDKNYLFKQIMEDAEPDWILHVDGDEELEPAGVEQIRASIASGQAPAYGLQVLYLWNDEKHIRTDGVYKRFCRQSLFSTRGTDGIFNPTAHGKGTAANLHCTNVPADLVARSMMCPARLIHYGYIDRAMRLAKYEFYNTVDPDNELEDRYRHIVAGDIPEVPARAITKWAGPLTIEPFAPVQVEVLA